MTGNKSEGEDFYDDNNVWNQNFEKVTKSVIQNGYADGVADGRESLYQKDFDRGYQEGFAMAFTLARHQGFAVGVGKTQDGEVLAGMISSDLILKQDVARAHCQLCLDKKLEENPLEEVLSVQQRHNESITGKHRERYGIVQ